MVTTLLLDVDGVVQLRRPEFAAEMDRDHPWRDGYAAFERALLADPGEAHTLTGGGDLADVVDRLLAEHVEGLSGAAFLARWLADATAPNKELLDLVPDISVDAVYLAVNAEAHRVGQIRARYGDRPWLTGVLASHELGHAKPTRAFFTSALRTIGREAEECLFVDDSHGYCAGAMSVGLRSVQFRDTAHLATQLSGLGLLRGGGPRIPGPRRPSDAPVSPNPG